MTSDSPQAETAPKAASARDLSALYRRHEAGEDVGAAWAAVFRDLDDDARAWLRAGAAQPRAKAESSASAPPEGDARAAALDSIRAHALIRAFRERGHLEADLDPLRLAEPEAHADLDPASYGFTEEDLDREVYLAGELGLDTATIREVLAVLRRDYCGKIGLEFMHLQDPDQKAWVMERMEGVDARARIKEEGKRAILERLTAAETFETILDRRFTGTKRFGLDGAESTLVALELMVRRAPELGIEELVIGMPHRGRLNVMANLMQKPFAAIFSEFEGGANDEDEIGGSGDVKYHLGTSTDRDVDGAKVHLSLTPNPSHLEAVNPVVAGKVRARQDQLGDTEHVRCLGVLLHGDAAFAGQGLVPETLQFCELPGYRCGGMVHLIVNNQIGFTTSPLLARSSAYCSDVAKMIEAPIVHVNGDDPEAVVQAADFAIRFRQTFHVDAVVDLVCYRRYGHNEGDEPAFTQPLMYRAIAEQPTTRETYAARLVEEGVVTPQDADRLVAEWRERLEKELVAASSWKPSRADWLEGAWSGLAPVQGYDARRGETGALESVLQEIGRALVTVPESLNLNRKIRRQLASREKMFASGEGVDWGTAEALAMGSLLVEGHPVRLSGEDCNRGTFSHRHASWIDQEDETRYVPLEHIRDPQARLEVLNSPLSEFGVLGFEYGYAMAEPNALVLWEAQFGDFVNGAQIVIDQFLAAGEQKWLRMNGLVLLLPHGFEGQGPEHSSARLERFLQLCAEDNLQVVSCTTPANYFHVLRRQMHRSFRKPLIVMSPKSLLRHKRCVSQLADFGPGTGFRRVQYDDAIPSDPAAAGQVVLCCGKVYYDLLAEREKRGITDVHFLRIEQLYPFPVDTLAELLQPYGHCHLVWCQEEPRNMGAWEHVDDVVEEIARGIGCKRPRLRYAGRPTAASPATGSHARHVAEQEALLTDALTVGVAPRGRLSARRPD